MTSCGPGIAHASRRPRGRANGRSIIVGHGMVRCCRPCSVIGRRPGSGWPRRSSVGSTIAPSCSGSPAAALDIVVPRKLGAPGNPELGIGAVAPGVRVVDERLVRALHVDSDYLDEEAARQEAELGRRLLA